MLRHSDPGVAFNSGSAARVPIIGPSRLMLTMRITSSHGISSNRPPVPIPALLNRRSSVPPVARPNRSAAAANAA